LEYRAAMTSKLATDGAKAEVSRLRGVAGEVAVRSKALKLCLPSALIILTHQVFLIHLLLMILGLVENVLRPASSD
jgi:hypothetical protein